MDSPERFVSIPQAAEQIGMSRTQLRTVCIAAGVAIRWGGSDARPHLKVKLSDAWRAVEENKYVPPRPMVNPPRRPVRREFAFATNPDLTC
jgi:hypothetical protein